MTISRRTKAAAYHEAGHALLAQLLGAQVRSVSINETGGGATAFVRPSDADLARIIAVAGEEAEKMAGHSDLCEFSREDFDTAGLDHDPVNRHFSFTTQSEIEEKIELAKPLARKILRDNWSKVVIVANALINQRALSGADLRRLLA